MRGRSSKTYLDTADDWDEPVWLEVAQIIDETYTPSVELAAGGSRAEEYNDNEVASRNFEWNCTYRYKKCNGDDAYAALFAAFIAGDAIFMAFLDGPITTVGSAGWRAPILIDQMPHARDLGSLVEVTVHGVGKLYTEADCSIRKPVPYTVVAPPATTGDGTTTTTTPE